MQDQEGGRYVVTEADDTMWWIVDMQTMKAYVLQVHEWNNFTVHLSLAEVMMTSEYSSHMQYLREIMAGTYGAYGTGTAQRLANFVLDELEDHDVANPINLASQIGADLHGQRVEWPTARTH
jgi:hypothetical protein